MGNNQPSYTSIVAARTRAAEYILGNKELLAQFEAKGGLKEDLIAIRDAGRRAEALDVAQKGAQAAGGAATVEVGETFANVQREYVSIMAVVQAVRHDFDRPGTPADLLAELDRILVNEAEVSIRD